MPAEHGRRLVAWLLLALLVAAGGTAQAAFAPPYPLIGREHAESLGLFLAHHADKDGKLTIDDVRQLPADAFVVPEEEGLHLGFSTANHWFRLALQNTLDEPAALLL